METIIQSSKIIILYRLLLMSSYLQAELQNLKIPYVVKLKVILLNFV